MIKLTVLALFVALQQGTSAEKDVNSRRLLQYYPQPYYPQGPSFYNPCNQPGAGSPCDPYSGCYDQYQCWVEFQAAQRPQAPQAVIPATPPANPPPAANPPATGATPPAANPGVTPPGPPANQSPGTPPQGAPPVTVIPPQGPSQGLPPYPPQGGAPPAGGPGGLYPIPGGLPPVIMPIGPNPALLGPPLAEAQCTGVTPMGTPAIPGTATSCQGRRACPPGPPAAGAPPCAGPMAYNNMAENFKMYCSAPGGCSNSEINMNLGPGQQVRSINQLLFSEAGAGQGSTVNVRNDQMIGNVVTIERLECSAPGACNQLTVNMWGASMNDVDCGMAADCAGCVINLWTQEPMPGCPNPGAAPGNIACLIETTPCFGY